VSRYDESLTLIAVLDHLRDAYDLAKEAGHPELQAHLMSARRKLVQALHQSLNLHSQLAEVQERLAQKTRDVAPVDEDAMDVRTTVPAASERRRMS
jgi:Lon protease-like protein